MEGQELRQTMVTIGLSVVLADIMLWIWGGQSYTILSPDWLSGPMTLPIVSAPRHGRGRLSALPRRAHRDPDRRHRRWAWRCGWC
jgi:hypothetical protein